MKHAEEINGVPIASSGGGAGNFASITGSPYDNTNLSNALNSKQDRFNSVVSGCVITVETFVGVGTNKRIRVTDGTWYITPSEYTKATDTVSAEITLCVTGGDFKYYDIVADDTGAITIYEGTPSTAPAHYVIDPVTEVLLGFVTVGDAVIEEPVGGGGSYLPLAGGTMTGDISSSASVFQIGIDAFARVDFYKLGNTSRSRLVASNFGDSDLREVTFQGETTGTTAKASIKAVNFTDGTEREFHFLSNGEFNFDGDIATYDADRTTKIDANPRALIDRGYADAHYSFTAASVAEINTGTENAKGATPLNLETSKYLTQSGSKTYAASSGTSTVYTVTLSPAITAYSAGQEFNIAIHTANTTTTPTINFDGLGARNILNKFGTAIAVNDFRGDVTLRYNGTAFEIINGVAANEVGNDKLAQMAANTIKANNTGSTANASDITTDQFTAMMEIAVAVGTTGIITGMTSATYKYIRLTSASATGLGSIVAPSSSYKDLYIWNDTGVTLTLYHDYSSEATAANRILCGANRSWANNTMLHLKYDVTESRWCTVAQDGNTFRALLAGSGTRLVAATSTGQEEATIQTLDIDFTGAQKTSATTASWTGVNEVNIAGLQQGQLYIDVSGGYRYECHRNDYCSRTPVFNVETFTTNSIYPIFEITGTNGTLAEDSVYVLNNTSQVVMTLPTAGTFGLVIIVHAKGAGGGRINTSATQQIVGTSGTQPTVGQDISFPQYSAITLKCTTGHATNAIWTIESVNPATTITII